MASIAPLRSITMAGTTKNVTSVQAIPTSEITIRPSNPERDSSAFRSTPTVDAMTAQAAI